MAPNPTIGSRWHHDRLGYVVVVRETRELAGYPGLLWVDVRQDPGVNVFTVPPGSLHGDPDDELVWR